MKSDVFALNIVGFTYIFLVNGVFLSLKDLLQYNYKLKYITKVNSQIHLSFGWYVNLNCSMASVKFPLMCFSTTDLLQNRSVDSTPFPKVN